VAGARPGTPEQESRPILIRWRRSERRRWLPIAWLGSACGEKDWYFAFQSQGISGGPWIGPTVEDTLKAIKAEGHVGVVMQPVGFLCDHVEILYDIDIAFRETARSSVEAVAGGEFERFAGAG
jgi:ferrochelatase